MDSPNSDDSSKRWSDFLESIGVVPVVIEAWSIGPDGERIPLLDSPPDDPEDDDPDDTDEYVP